MVNNKGIVRLHFLSSFHLPQIRKLKSYILNSIEKEKKSIDSIDYIFCSDNYLLDINKTYLRHNEYTDIITFDLSEPKKKIIGEIYISVDRVKDNAIMFKTPFLSELHRVMFHGALHLCGYTDKTEFQKVRMRKKENALLDSFR